MGNETPIQATPSLEQVIGEALENELLQLHTVLPGEVKAVHAGDGGTAGTVDVQPVLMRKYVSEPGPTPIPTIPRVPVKFLRAGPGCFRVPMAVGVKGSLFFCERSIERWWGVGGNVDPLDNRRHALADAFFVPGLYPSTETLAPNGAADSVEIQNGGTWIELTSGGKIKLSNGTQELVTVLYDLVNTLESAQVLDPLSGALPFTPATITAITAIATRLASLKA